jgi:hypothetical protein
VRRFTAEYKGILQGAEYTKPNEFTFPNGFVYWVTKGYVVLDDAAFPIIVKEQQNQTIIL